MPPAIWSRMVVVGAWFNRALRSAADARIPMYQPPPCSLNLPPRGHPGRCGYLRGSIYAICFTTTPLGDLSVGTRSRRNLMRIRFTLDAGEIVPRLRTCTQVTERRDNLAEGVEYTTEISTTPRNAMRRRSRRKWQHVAHGVDTARSEPSRKRAPKRAWHSRAPHAAILAEIVATRQSPAFWISPGCALRPPPDCHASR